MNLLCHTSTQVQEPDTSSFGTPQHNTRGWACRTRPSGCCINTPTLSHHHLFPACIDLQMSSAHPTISISNATALRDEPCDLSQKRNKRGFCCLRVFETDKLLSFNQGIVTSMMADVRKQGIHQAIRQYISN